MLRGGSWNNNPRNCRSAYRNRNNPDKRLIRKANIRQFRRRVAWMRKAYAAGVVDWKSIRPRLASWLGHARQANSERLIRRLARDWRFQRSLSAFRRIVL